MISYWKVQDLSYPDRTGLQLRLVRHGIPCRDRKVIGGFKKAVLSAPVKRQKARTERDFLGHPGLHHDFATARDDFHEIRILDGRIAAHLRDGSPEWALARFGAKLRSSRCG